MLRRSLMTAVTCSLFALGAGSATAGEIKVGSVAGITGPIAELVAPIMDGRALAAQHINENGGLLGGDTMVMVPADSQCDPSGGVDAGNKVVNIDQVVAMSPTIKGMGTEDLQASGATTGTGCT